MKTATTSMEPRKQKRFHADNRMYAVLEYKPALMGRIINISKTGFAVLYPSNGQRLSESLEVDIYRLDSAFYMEKIKIKTVSDFEIDTAYGFGLGKIRQRSMQFGEMKPIQMFQLNYFLQNYTLPE